MELKLLDLVPRCALESFCTCSHALTRASSWSIHEHDRNYRSQWHGGMVQP